MDTRLLAVLALLTTALVISPADYAAPSPSSSGSFVAHEWGTFTSVQGADGEQLWWDPLVTTDLPDFVYDDASNNGAVVPVSRPSGRAIKSGTSARLRMETPVIYFYSDVERAVDVRVQFPKGQITEWYPQATRVGGYQTAKLDPAVLDRSMIEWNGVKVLAPNTSETSADALIRAQNMRQGSHYYAARATDANFLRVTSPHARSGEEHERDLFYRGIGTLPAPLKVTLDAEEQLLAMATTGTKPIESAFVLRIRRGTMQYLPMGRLLPEHGLAAMLDRVPFGELNEVRERAMADMVGALTRAGLYEKEARAMVDTWKDQWFAEEGTRVLYLLPRAWTDSTLPLQISPQPTSVVRVMVGRAELLPLSVERSLHDQIMAYTRGDAAVRHAAVENTRRLGLGRFVLPALQKAWYRSEPYDEKTSEAISQFIEELKRSS
jgi:hypothetical protein